MGSTCKNDSQSIIMPAQKAAISHTPYWMYSLFARASSPIPSLFCSHPHPGSQSSHTGLAARSGSATMVSTPDWSEEINYLLKPVQNLWPCSFSARELASNAKCPPYM